MPRSLGAQDRCGGRRPWRGRTDFGAEKVAGGGRAAKDQAGKPPGEAERKAAKRPFWLGIDGLDGRATGAPRSCPYFRARSIVIRGPFIRGGVSILEMSPRVSATRFMTL